MTHHRSRWPRALAAAVAMLAIIGIGALATGAQAQRGPLKTYLPLVVQPAGKAAPPPTPAPGGGVGEMLFSRSSTRSADVAVDARGGIHSVAVRDNPRFPDDPEALIYAYCPPANLGRCAERAAWSFVELAADAPFAQIALTPQGKPRILYEEGAGAATYVYAACDAECTNPARWARTATFSRAAINSGYVFDYRPQYFALDPQGRPRFLYGDHHPTGTQEHTGTFYAYCDEACTEQGSWRESVITREVWGEQLNLTFTSAGGVRALAQSYWPDDAQAQNGRLNYLSCDADCADAGNWGMIPLLDRGYEHAQYTIALDDKDRPRILYYQGYHEGPRGDAQLWYLWCDAADCVSTAGWDGRVITTSASAGDADLAFDTKGRPRIVVSRQAELFYAFCDSACQSAQGEWKTVVIDAAASAERASPVKLLPGCIEGSWVAGLRPALALSPNGDPRIAFDAQHLMRCYKDPDRPDLGTYTEDKWTGSAVIYFPHP